MHMIAEPNECTEVQNPHRYMHAWLLCTYVYSMHGSLCMVVLNQYKEYWTTYYTLTYNIIWKLDHIPSSYIVLMDYISRPSWHRATVRCHKFELGHIDKLHVHAPYRHILVRSAWASWPGRDLHLPYAGQNREIPRVRAHQRKRTEGIAIIYQ